MMSATKPAGMRPATEREHLITILTSVWVTLGILVDGYAHDNLLDATEDFFTPWHGIFYSGFGAITVWFAFLANSRRLATRNPLGWLPVGYRLGALGIGLFAIGGAGDAVWHTVFGIESGFDALVSPTHLLLMIGLILIVTSPFRARWHFDTEPTPRLADFRAPLAALTLAVSLVTFSLAYVWALGIDSVLRVSYDPVTQAGVEAVAAGFGGAVVTTVILIGAALLMLRRWDPPRGTFTTLFGVASAVGPLTFGWDIGGLFAGLLGGLVLDLVLGLRLERILRIRLGALIAPLTIWSSWYGWQALGPDDGIAWQAELWGGAIVYCGLTGLAISLLAFPHDDRLQLDSPGIPMNPTTERDGGVASATK